MYRLVLFFTAAALLGDCNSANVNNHLRQFQELDEKIEANLFLGTVPHKYVKLNNTPPGEVWHDAGPLQLTCEAMGSPAPSVRWFYNDRPIYELGMESTEWIESPPATMARMVSTLLVARPASGAYTCVAGSGTRHAQHTTHVHIAHGTGTNNTDTLATERARLWPLAPRILVYYHSYLTAQGGRAVLACRARGHPRPRVQWRDRNGNDVEADPRMTVLSSGELIIRGVTWEDVGEFTCVASNRHGRDEIYTFLYPATPS